ncbi:MAG TPA: helix-turn-helix domain-containing protein [Novosphingobium sp.]|nr:helix-turn-helix domain-containing protein [Novosphingobium sp.]
MATPKNYSKSASRALDIVELLADCDLPLRAAEIAARLDLSRSSTDQLLKTMLANGSLLLDPWNMTYSPSPRIARIGLKLADRVAEVDRYQAVLDEIHARSGQVVTLTVQNDCHMQVLAYAGNFGHALHVGMQVPIFGSTIGSAALSGKSPRTIGKLVKRARRQHLIGNEGDWTGSFLDRISAIRLKGYACRPLQAYDDRVGKTRDMWTIGLRANQDTDRDSPVVGLMGPLASVRGGEQNLVNLIRRTLRQTLAA